MRYISLRADLLEASQILETAALDPYAFMRDAYLQRRRNQVYDGNPPPDEDDIEDVKPKPAPGKDEAMFARVSIYEVEEGRASEALAAFSPAIDRLRDLEGFVDGYFLVENDGIQGLPPSFWESLAARARSRRFIPPW